jgi:hypothetical protein
MLSRLVRLVAVVICLVAPLGWVARADAGTTDTVEVTGEVIDTALSLTITAATFSLGTVDATGNSYDPVSSLAEPFTVGSNALGVPEGIAWVAKAPLSYTVTSPAFWLLTFCSSTESGTLDGATPLLYLPGARPSGSPADAISGRGVRACSSGNPGYDGSFAGVNQTFSFYPTYVVRTTDTPHTFSATIQFALSLL